MTIVVADDSPSLRTLVRITLASQGWDIVEAETPEAARERIGALRPDLAILDVTFGETGPDGLALCAELKADPATAAIPIVILTGHDDGAERKRAEGAGASAFIAKPFGPIDLMRVVRDLLPMGGDAPALGVYLLDAGVVQPTQLEAALSEQRTLDARGRRKRLGDVLLERGSVSAIDIERAVLRQMNARTRDATRRVRVLVVDDHPAVREGLRQLISSDPALEQVGEASSAPDALRLAGELKPDVVLLDNEMPGQHGIEILAELRAILGASRVVMFSLEHGVREHALRAGASAFVAKDAPTEEVLRALRPATPAAPPAPATAPALPPPAPAVAARGPRRRRTVEALAGICLLYVFLFIVVLEPLFDASAGVFSVAVVAMAGALLGPEAGLVGAALAIVLTFVLWTVTGHVLGETVVRIGGSGIGIVLLVLVGAGTGAMRELGTRLDPRRRRADALADVTESLAGLDRRELIDTFLDAIRRVLAVDALVLYANVAGRASFVGSTLRTADPPDALAAIVDAVMRSDAVRAVDELRPEERPAPDLRSALVLPITAPRVDARGAIVLLHRSAKRYRVDDAALVRPFARHLWLTLSTAAERPADVAATAASVAPRRSP